MSAVEASEYVDRQTQLSLGRKNLGVGSTANVKVLALALLEAVRRVPSCLLTNTQLEVGDVVIQCILFFVQDYLHV